LGTDSSEGIRVTVLGPVRAWRAGHELDVGPVKQQAVLAALVLRPGVIVPAERLLGDVWGDEPPGSGHRVIAGYVHRIRRSLGDGVITSGRGGYRFDPVGTGTDVARLAELNAKARRAKQSGDLAAALDACSEALRLYDGEPLTGLPGPLADGERQRLTQYRLTLAREKAEHRIGLRQYAEAASELGALLTERPYDEPAAGWLMRALYGDGRPQEALAVYARLYESMTDLGMEPAQETRRLQQAILRHDDQHLLGAAARPASPRSQVPRQLPADGYLAGRDAELALLSDLAGAARPDRARVVAVDGLAGIGKTALVIGAAWAVQDRYPDGSLFLDLHGHSQNHRPLELNDALRRLLRAVGTDTSAAPDEPEELTALWRAATASRRLLVVVDDAVGAEQVRPLLPSGAGSLVLVTSRRRMAGLDVEGRVTLGPLGGDAAAELMRHVVGAERAGREPAAIAELIRLLGGLPLALRIAGARLQTRPAWTLADLVSQLAAEERRLTGLAAEDRSVETAFRLSYENLPATAQRAFRALGVSPSVESDPLAVAAMLDHPLPETESLLEDLVDASLLQQPAFRRYRLHDMVAVYARRLAAAHGLEAAEARTRALRLYLTAGRYASDAGPASFPTGPHLGTAPFLGWRDAAQWLDTMTDELAGIVRHAVTTGQADDACWLAEALTDCLIHKGLYRECRSALEAALSQADKASDSRMTASLRISLAITYCLQGHHEQALPWVREALVHAGRIGNRREQARATAALGFCELASGQAETAAGHFAEAQSVARELDDDWLSVMAPFYLGVIQHRQGHHQGALEHLGQSLAVAERIGSPRPMSRTLAYIGTVLLDLDQAEHATQVLQRATDIAEDARDITLHAQCLARLGTSRLRLGDTDGALALHQRALAAVTDQACPDMVQEIHARLAESQQAITRLPVGWQEVCMRCGSMPSTL
jgi:DNA-binding SARP family transcriptional activator/Tfp pilus assembly protein PilF